MKSKISVLTIILILATIISFFNISNSNVVLNSFNYSDCLNQYSHLLNLGKQIDICSNQRKINVQEETLYFNILLSIAFIFLFLTILSWKFDSYKNMKKISKEK